MQNLSATFQDSLAQMWRSFLDRLPYVLVGLALYALFYLLARLASALISRIGVRANVHQNLRELAGRISAFVLNILGLFVAATVIFPAFRPGDLIAGLGITTVAISFALKDIFQNFFAGLLLLWRQPFHPGDEIKVKDFEGVVESISSRSTFIRTYDGERAVIPNGDVYTSALLVRTAFSLRRVRLVVGIGYDDSIDLARQEILQALDRIEAVEKDPGPWVYASAFSPSTIDLTVFFWTASSQANVLKVSDRVVEVVKSALDEAGVDIPFPHVVVMEPRPSGTAAKSPADSESGSGSPRSRRTEGPFGE